MGNEQGRLAGEPTPAGIQSMDESLQRKFAKGIQYNMKIVIRGDRNTGKSCLFHRMEGKPFQEAYVPTNEIQVTSILWSYRVTNDTVKVEIWDIVDKGRTQKKNTRGGGLLKMFNEPEDQEEGDDKVLDAGFLDVYKGAHGVVFLYDITKQWTWQYIERELPKVPFHLPVIILGNFRDMGDHRVVSREVCFYYIEHMDRPEGAADVRYAEGSMKNGFGLMHLHKFLSIPFLQLQQETLLQQLQVNREQTLAAREELDSAHRTEDQNYDQFEQKLERLAEERGRRRTKSIEQEPGPGDESPTTPRRRDLVEAESIPGGEEATDYSHREQQLPQRQTSSPSDQDRDRKGSFKTKLTSKLSGFLSRVKEESGKREGKPSSAATPPLAAASRPRAKPTTKVEDFVPEGDVDGFFEDEEDEEGTEEDDEDDSDENTQTGKPQIIMDEDLSSPEEEETPPPAPPTVSKPSPQVKRPAVVLKSAKDIELTESEEEEETPDIMADEDVGDEDTTPALLTSKKTKDVLSGELVPAVEKKKKETKSSGLMLEFNLPSPTPPQPKKTAPPNEEKRESPKGTPDVGEKRRDSKSKKKSKKSRHDKDETERTKTKSTGQQGGGGGGDGVTGQVTVASDDPFGPIAALDAWLNSDSTEPTSDMLQPSKVEVKEEAKAKPSSVEMGEEAEEEGESPETRHKKSKKHKHHHKKHHRGEREGEGEEGTSSSSRKKHRHHHRSSRHGESSNSSRPSVEAPGEYDEI